MTPIADMVEQMLAGGVSHSAIVLAVRTAENVTHSNALRNALPKGAVLSDAPSAVKQRRYRQNRKQNQPSAEANDAVPGGAQPANAGGNALRNGVTERCDLTSSFLSKGTSKTGSKKEGVARGTRLSSEVPLSDADRKFAIDNGMSNPDALWAEFIDYWIGIPGQRGTKLNWSATWRNRVRAVSTKNGKYYAKAAPNGLAQALGRLKQHIGTDDGGEVGSGPSPRLLSHG